MDSFRDRLGARSGRERYDRGERSDRYDREDRADRYDRQVRYDEDETEGRSGRRAGSNSVDSIQIGDITKAMEQSNSKQLEIIADCFEDVKEEVFSSEKEILKAIDRIADSTEAVRGQVVNAAPASPQPVMDESMKEEILAAVFSNTNLLNSIRELLDRKEQEEVTTQEEKPVGQEGEKPIKDIMTELLSAYYNNMEDHVHKENVKCYRNVQAALAEQGIQLVDQNKKSLSFLKVFAIINLALTLMNIVLAVGNIMGWFMIF